MRSAPAKRHVRRAGVAWQVLALTFISCLLITLTLSAAGVEKASVKKWERVLKPLRSMPVQDFGFVRSAFTFGENHLLAIAGSRSYMGMSGMHAVIRFMSDPEFARTAPLIKIVRPELGKMLGAKRISVAQYRDHAVHSQLMQLVKQDQKRWLRPIEQIDTQVRYLESLEDDFAIIPRPEEWVSPLAITHGASTSDEASTLDHALVTHWEALKQALRADDAQAGSEAARQLAESVRASAQLQGIRLPQLGLDVFYHSYQPFALSAFFYLFSALVYGTSLLLVRRWLGWLGFVFLALGFLAQLLGLAARWILAGRPPLSNMYESFTFTIAGIVLLALILEMVNKTRFVGLGAAILGFILMVVAHKAPIFNSQIRPLVPALQSSWLTYHVVTIMLSYSAFALSCFFSVTYLCKEGAGGDEANSRLLRRLPTLQTLDVLNYKIIAVGFPLLTLGIVFGAVWAATAWGRPWGFDPKETWSAITWLVYAIYLHARFLAGWKGRHSAIISVLGFGSVLFTYLGVNYLLPGLHSYV